MIGAVSDWSERVTLSRSRVRLVPLGPEPAEGWLAPAVQHSGTRSPAELLLLTRAFQRLGEVRVGWAALVAGLL